MNKWKHQVSIASLHKQYQAGELSPQELATSVASLLEIFILPKFPDDFELEEIIGWFKDSEDINSINDYDNLLKELYDWADDNRVWINCFE
jgi:hypothetical protein